MFLPFPWKLGVCKVAGNQEFAFCAIECCVLQPLPREIVYDIWISDPLTGGRAWLAQVTSEALACSMAAEIEAGRLPVELRRIADGWSALWSGAVSSPQLAEPGRGSC